LRVTAGRIARKELTVVRIDACAQRGREMDGCLCSRSFVCVLSRKNGVAFIARIWFICPYAPLNIKARTTTSLSKLNFSFERKAEDNSQGSRRHDPRPRAGSMYARASVAPTFHR